MGERSMKKQNEDNDSAQGMRDVTASTLAQAALNNCTTRITLLQDTQKTGETEEWVSAV